MINESPQPNESEVDRAIAARLSKLRTLPVDTSRLDAALLAQIPKPRVRRFLSLRPLQAMAASFLLLAGITIAIVLTASSGPAMASAAQMAQVHEDIVAGRVPIMQVDSIEAANRMLAAEAPGVPPLPQMPEEHVMACCMKSVQNKKMACVLLKKEGVPITLAVAKAADMKLPRAEVRELNGVSYRVQSFGKLSMVMTERNDHWLCMMGELDADKLMDMASQVKF